jgi:hypothetical protein
VNSSKSEKFRGLLAHLCIRSGVIEFTAFANESANLRAVRLQVAQPILAVPEVRHRNIHFALRGNSRSQDWLRYQSRIPASKRAGVRYNPPELNPGKILFIEGESSWQN